MDIALGLNSSGTNHSTFPDYRNPPLDVPSQMPADGSVYTIANTSAATLRQAQNIRYHENHLQHSHNFHIQSHNDRHYPVHVHGQDVRIQNDSSQNGNHTGQLDTPPPTYHEFISGVTFL